MTMCSEFREWPSEQWVRSVANKNTRKTSPLTLEGNTLAVITSQVFSALSIHPLSFQPMFWLLRETFPLNWLPLTIRWKAWEGERITILASPWSLIPFWGRELCWWKLSVSELLGHLSSGKVVLMTALTVTVKTSTVTVSTGSHTALMYTISPFAPLIMCPEELG